MNLFCIKLCMNMSIKTQLSCLRFLWFLNSTISLVQFVSIYLFLLLSGNKRDLMIDALKACFMNHMSAFQSRQIALTKRCKLLFCYISYVEMVPIRASISCVLCDLVCTLHFQRELSVDLLFIGETNHRNMSASHTTLALNFVELEPGKVTSRKE